MNWYSYLPLRLRDNVASLREEFRGHKGVLENLLHMLEEEGCTSQTYVKENIIDICILSRVTLEEVLLPRYLSRLCCYHYLKPNKYFNIAGVLNKNERVKIIFCERNKVAKWFSGNLAFEISIYQRLEEEKCPLPYFSTSYRIWNKKILFMERLFPLEEHDNPYEIGICVLEQLYYLHRFGVHNDIKPCNILKRGKQYFLIDFGGVATEKLLYGYKRWNWSRSWTCQKMHAKEQVTTAKHDFIELGYVINSLLGSEQPRKNFYGKILEYMEQVRQIDEENIEDNIYGKLKNILAK